MKNPTLAARYAGALYDFAEETKNVANIYHDILHIQKIISTHRELKTVMESPIIFQNKKQQIVNEIFQKSLHEITFNFFMLIVKKRREPQLLTICEQFVKIYYNNHNIKEVSVTSAQPLSDEMVVSLKNYLEKDSPYTFIFQLSVDPHIIGGCIIKLDDYYFNASVQAKINKLKAEFSQNPYTIGF